MATAGNVYTGFNPDEELRIVLIGTTGSGKSSSANTILRQEVFKTDLSPCSVTSECSKARGVVKGCRLAVIDTPGIFDTKYKEEEVFRKLYECISLSAPGPHVFLIVIRLSRFTVQEQKTVEFLRQVFGDKVAAYSMVLFTYGEELRNTTIEAFVSKCGKLSSLVADCHQRYHVFSNTVPDNRQVLQLLVKIKGIIRDNRGTCYTNAMFQEAERAIQERAMKIMKYNEKQKLREEEKLRASLEGEQLKEGLKGLDEQYKIKSREKAEKKNKFIETGMIAPTAEVGMAIGVGVLAAGGPLCMAVGAVTGGVVGAAVGAFAPVAAKALKNKCSVQ
ncbi:GTPase IMAP family member 7-like [Mugil cephalus]|uniref:GTPase IMAP family member 7-like n=1 Tax=Mugil cephalus TaxID=48193 RepID=UPI001FB59237|nr:GTPase IMAP family member 7-like [Mugil cephalus]